MLNNYVPVRFKKLEEKSSQEKISGAIINHSVTGPLWSQEPVICHLENKGGQWEIPHCPSNEVTFFCCKIEFHSHHYQFQEQSATRPRRSSPSIWHYESKRHLVFTNTYWRGNGNPLQYSCLENSTDRGAWWAAVHGVAQSQTRLKRLSMHVCIGEVNGNPLQYYCLENPRDGGAWWAAVYGVAQSRTRLKWVSSSNTYYTTVIRTSQPTRSAAGNGSAATAKSLQSCPTLCDPVDGSPSGFPVPGILQARTLEWVAISFSNAWKGKVKVKSLSRAQLLATPWTAAYQAPPSMGFSRQVYWSGVPLPSPGNGSGGIKHKTLHLILCTSPAESTDDLKSYQPASATQQAPSSKQFIGLHIALVFQIMNNCVLAKFNRLKKSVKPSEELWSHP